MQTYILLEYGEIGNESKDIAVSCGVSSDIGVTLNTYTHLGLEDAAGELKHMEDLENARKELDKTSGRKTVTQKMFRAVLMNI